MQYLPRDNRYMVGVAIALLGGTFLSLSGIMIRNIEAADGWQILFYRSLATFLTIFVFLVFQYRGNIARRFADIGGAGLLAALVLSVGSIFYIMALLNTTVANVVFIIGASPLLAALAGWLFLRERAPTGESNGSTVNHLGFKVPDLHGLVPRLKAAGIEIVTTEVVAGATSDVHHNTAQNVYMAFAKGPDGVRVELMENKELDGIDSHHIHIFTDDDEATQAWYVKHFGGKPGTRGPFRKADVPGIELTFAKATDPVEPTKGRAVDHIGFEVDDLESFCKRLEAEGVKLDVPFRKIESSGLSVAFLTDPWGTYIELTEGLDKF